MTEKAMNSMQAHNNTTNTAHTTFNVDPEHSGIRAVGCITLAIVFVAGFLTLSSIIENGAVVAFFGSLVIAVGIVYPLDFILKRTWPSGRVLQIENQQIRLTKNGTLEDVIDGSQHVNLLRWYFEVNKTSRVKKGWYVMSCTLEQDGTYLAIYSFTDPDTFKQMPMVESFIRLQRKRKGGQDEMSSERQMRLAGEQRRLHEAEQIRADFGAEVVYTDFVAFLNLLQQQFPDWTES